MPVEAEISESDGDTRTVRFPVEIWKQGGSQTVHVETDSRLKSVRLDPSNLLPDANSSNDTWSPDPSIGSASGSP